jgi:hypothetical protein
MLLFAGTSPTGHASGHNRFIFRYGAEFDPTEAQRHFRFRTSRQAAQQYGQQQAFLCTLVYVGKLTANATLAGTGWHRSNKVLKAFSLCF